MQRIVVAHCRAGLVQQRGGRRPSGTHRNAIALDGFCRGEVGSAGCFVVAANHHAFDAQVAGGWLHFINAAPLAYRNPLARHFGGQHARLAAGSHIDKGGHFTAGL